MESMKELLSSLTSKLGWRIPGEGPPWGAFGGLSLDLN